MTDIDNVIIAFSADHVVHLTGLSKSQLRYWDRIGFFSPQYAAENRRTPYSRIYSFKNVVGLRTLSLLRKEHQISLQHLRQTAETLSSYDQSLWSEVRLYVLRKKVYFLTKAEDTAIDIQGQFAKIIWMKDVISDVAAKARKLRERAPDQYGQIEQHRFVMRNAWVVAGTRIPISAIKDFHDAGYSVAEIIKEYPALKREDVDAALKHEERLAKLA